MDSRYTIAPARLEDIGALPRIEKAAALLLEGHVPVSVLHEVTGESDFHEALAGGRLLVALANGEPIGFALIEMLARDRPHLEEIDVHPDHGRRGVGTALMRAVLEWVSDHGHAQITLTTFRAVPWNMPFYARLGFEEISADEMGPELTAVVADEAARGLDPRSRTVMRYRVRRPPAGVSG